MKLTCPVCESKVGLGDFAASALRNELVNLAAYYGANWPLVYEYVQCYRAAQWASQRLDKTVRMLGELRKIVEGGLFEYEGKRYRIERCNVLAAMRKVADLEKFGLPTNHSYLKKVMLGCGAERVSAEGMTAREEAKREERRKVQGKRIKGDGEGAISAEEFKRRQGLESLVGKIGEKTC